MGVLISSRVMICSHSFIGQQLSQPNGYGDLVKTLWVRRDISAPSETVWELLTNPERWPEWGPLTTSAVIAGQTPCSVDR